MAGAVPQNDATRQSLILPGGGRVSAAGDESFDHGQANFLRINAEAERGVASPRGNIFSYLVMSRQGPAMSALTRVDDNYRLIERLAARTQGSPQERVTGITLISGNNFYHRPSFNSELKGSEFFIRSIGDPQESSSARPPFRGVPHLDTRAGRIVATEAQGNRAAFRGFVARNGLGFALIEHVGHTSDPSTNSIGFDNHAFCCMQAQWDVAHANLATRVATSLTQPVNRFLPGIPAPVPLYSSLVRFKARPEDFPEQPVPFPTPNSASKWDALTARSRLENAPAEAGMVAPNGFFWTYAAMVGEPLFDRLSVSNGDQNERFLSILLDWANKHPSFDIRGSHYKKLVGPFHQDPRDPDNQDRSHQEVPMWECLLRGRDTSVPLPTRDPEKAARSGGKLVYDPAFLNPTWPVGKLAPTPPKSFEQQLAWTQRRQNLPAEGLVPHPRENHLAMASDHWLNRFGEGFCFFEFSEATLTRGERSMAEQRFEVLKRIRGWHMLSPFLEITESHFWQGHFAEFMDSSIYSNQRNFIFRVRDFDWDSLPEAERARISERTRRYKLPPPKTADSAYTHRHLSAMKGAWAGLEADDGSGWAMIDFVVPFPSKGNSGVRDTNAQFVRLAAQWAETFWWREIVCTEVLREWSAHQNPESPEESFAYTLYINFRRRETPEAKGVDAREAVADILNAGQFPWDERYAARTH